ncbi:MAG: hypothetical protein EOM50_09060 [Erysipelotrichia bacterium]|nr:hypothetical protein [Erysipelotrichia bacterium]NCC53916.1 hypothetical protein [Erysipelotrichia bacterium]
MKKNTKGSTLVAAVAVIMVIMVILGASLTIASSYYKRSVNENIKKQVYLDAKSGANVIASYIEEGNEQFIPKEKGNKIQIKEVSVESVSNTLSGYVLRVDEHTMKVVMVAKFDEQFTYSIQLVMKFEQLRWKTNAYCKAKEGDTLC